MERVTEKPNWEGDVFKDAVVAQWYADALLASKEYDQLRPDDFSGMDVDMDLVTQRTWDWCTEELRDKAKTFKPIVSFWASMPIPRFQVRCVDSYVCTK
ncbi:hypothetical protein N7478_008908 [Penicillium angulare]|uniref:uncharacterized protein n=1 Tax=Penicillium angulare TaxID=116970 RepID=UPI0025418A08|nr:uncharacterized protein N7478_008908 [Penicillium angulare]KAJ5273783.1 hypothetical protein N7478_008908 [Penicillium angulare]